MAGESNRRGFLRELGMQVARGAGELLDQAQSATEAIRYDEPATDLAPSPSRALPADVPNRCAALDDVCMLVQETGLDRHLEAVLALCRWSLRLNPPSGHTAQPTDPAVATADASPDLERCVVELNLERVAELGQPGLLPGVGLLGLFVGEPSAPADAFREYPRACSALWSPTPAPAIPAAVAAGITLELGPELTLPRVWADSVGDLELDEHEMRGWEDLRHRLAGIQGVVPFDGFDEPQSLHRLLGYPDERQGNMPLASEMLSQGIDLADVPAVAHPRADEFVAGAERWLLLAQLSDDDRLGWSWGSREQRLYIWIHEKQLAAGDFTNVRAFVQ